MTQEIPKITGSKVLVTGGAGFIGSKIARRLAPDNVVTVLDSLVSGTLANIEPYRDHIKFVKGDIRDKDLVARAIDGMDYVFHLAGQVGVLPSLKDPYYDMDVNIHGALNVLEACRNTKIKRLVYSCSAAIFGEAKYLPIDEDHPTNPESPYAVSKLSAEKYIMAYSKTYGLPAVSLRYFNAYGPGQEISGYANAISIFLGNTRDREPITVFGDGEQTRDFIYVEDIVDANILAATHPAATGQTFNIAAGKSVSINELLTLVREVTGRRLEIRYDPARAGEIKHSRANVEKARTVLGYAAKTDIKTGLELTWKAIASRHRDA